MNAYIKRGVDGEIILVIRGYDEEVVEAVISKLQHARSKALKILAEQLEKDFNGNDSTRGTISKTKPKD